MRVISARRALQVFVVVISLFVFLKLQSLWSENIVFDLFGPGSPRYSRYLEEKKSGEEKFNSVVEVPEKDLNYSSKAKRIVVYTSFYGNNLTLKRYAKYKVSGGKTNDPLGECAYRCEWSTNPADYNQSDAAVFHLYNNLENKDFVLRNLPKRLSEDQKWVIIIREPPSFYYPEQMKMLNGLFNLTMTYQSDSDVHIPYGTYWKLLPEDIEKMANESMDYLTGKNKTAVWLASNCITSSRREQYVKELQKYIDIDIYGECGNDSSADNKTPDKFRRVLSHQYKFYLAFENSDCDEYITEKFWRNMRLGMIPIVRGHRAQYKKLAPPNSYIHADSFLTVENLANYLKKISSNSTLFHKYHQWRLHYNVNSRIFTVNRGWLCDLCEKVHTTPRQTIDLYNHFSESTRCFTYLDHLGRNRSGEHMEDIDRV